MRSPFGEHRRWSAVAHVAECRKRPPVHKRQVDPWTCSQGVELAGSECQKTHTYTHSHNVRANGKCEQMAMATVQANGKGNCACKLHEKNMQVAMENVRANGKKHTFQKTREHHGCGAIGEPLAACTERTTRPLRGGRFLQLAFAWGTAAALSKPLEAAPIHAPKGKGEQGQKRQVQGARREEREETVGKKERGARKSLRSTLSPLHLPT